MTMNDELFRTAKARAVADKLPYAGAVTPAEAYELLERHPGAMLVDVRTQAELDWIGRPLVAAQQYVNVEWNVYPGGSRNPSFIEQLGEKAPKDAPILLLCRSAVRSKAAAQAAAAAGYSAAFDILEGFEGGKDASGHRKSVEGWCFRGLPWAGA